MSNLHQMLPNLWQGSLIDALVAPADIVLSCTPASSVTIARPRLAHVFFPFEDKAALPDMETAERLAQFLAAEIRAGRSVIVNCDLGHNRSALMVALTLRALGVADGKALVDYVRARNPRAFTAPNDGGPFFAAHLSDHAQEKAP
jgi:protein-tyrosine phosphatase